MLFLASNDLAAWRKAAIFGLEDGMMPFKEIDLDGVAANPKRVFNQQWRVRVKQVPMNGGITELENIDVLPLHSLCVVREKAARTTDKVRWLDDRARRVYVRKTAQFSSQAEKQNALDQIRIFKRLKHPNVISLTCAYSQGLNVAAITPAIEWDLENFLNTPSNTRRPERLLGWISDLTQALAHIHQSELLHRDIRPAKVLIDTNHRILFSFFGLPSTTQTPRSVSIQQYIYAAPEVIHRHKSTRHADIFSLGCLFLDILTAATQPTLDAPLAEFAAFRAATPSNPLPPNPLSTTSSSSSTSTSTTLTAAVPAAVATTKATLTISEPTGPATDASFHAHLDRVHAWMARLRAAIPAGRDAEPLSLALTFVAHMLAPEATKRPRTRLLAAHMGHWDQMGKTQGVRRKSEG